MNAVFPIGYFLIAIAFGIWTDAMDRTYGVKPGLQSWGMTTLCAALWPVAAPIAMTAIATGGSTRWANLNSAVQ